MEDKLDKALEKSAKNEVRIKFLGIGLVSLFGMIGTYIKSKLGI
jgi:hypothetical protein